MDTFLPDSTYKYIMM